MLKKHIVGWTARVPEPAYLVRNPLIAEAWPRKARDPERKLKPSKTTAGKLAVASDKGRRKFSQASLRITPIFDSILLAQQQRQPLPLNRITTVLDDLETSDTSLQAPAASESDATLSSQILEMHHIPSFETPTWSGSPILSSSTDVSTPLPSTTRQASSVPASDPSQVERDPTLLPPPSSTTLTVTFLSLGMIFSFASQHRSATRMRRMISIHSEDVESCYSMEFAARKVLGVRLIKLCEELPFTNAKLCGYGCRSTSRFMTRGYANGIE